jgi:hypothetical protein
MWLHRPQSTPDRRTRGQAMGQVRVECMRFTVLVRLWHCQKGQELEPTSKAEAKPNQWRCYSVSRRRLMPCSSAARRLAALNLPKPHQPTDSRCSSAAACPSGKERAAGSTLRSEIAEPRRANWQLRRMSAFRATPPDRAPGHARHPRIRGTKLPGARGGGTWKRSESLGPGATLLRTARHVYVCMYYNDRYTAKPGMGV